jgi:hypothetical protein
MAMILGQARRKNPNMLAEKLIMILKPQTVMRACNGGVVKGVGS